MEFIQSYEEFDKYYMSNLNEFDDMYTNDVWNKFAKYYNDNKKCGGHYKYKDNKWQWYSLEEINY
ncbi:MAG TPA: hypothetical protein PKY44_06180 [Bacteroidales bacterium]|nr:hypothetical protein [Bacteroidales bacterium]